MDLLIAAHAFTAVPELLCVSPLCLWVRALAHLVLLGHTEGVFGRVLQWSSRVQCLSVRISMLLPRRWLELVASRP